MINLRIGNGIDFHPLVDNRPLIIGGENLEYHRGSEGHSDGDVLVHAIIDALLGAFNLGDIGTHFSSNENKWKDISSIKMLKICSKNFCFSKQIINIDSTIILQTPKVHHKISAMKSNITNALNINTNQLSIKATTTDKLGFIGTGMGIGAFASCLIELKK